MATERRAKVAEQIEHLTMLFKKIRLFYDNVNEMCPDDPDDDVSKGRDVSLCKVIPSTWNPKHGIFSDALSTLFQVLVAVMGQPFEEKFTPSPDSCFKYKIGKEENREMVEVRCCFFHFIEIIPGRFCFVGYHNSEFWNINLFFDSHSNLDWRTGSWRLLLIRWGPLSGKSTQWLWWEKLDARDSSNYM